MLVLCFLISSLFSFEEEFKNLIDELRTDEKYQGIGEGDKTNDLIDLYNTMINNELHNSKKINVIFLTGCESKDDNYSNFVELINNERFNFAAFTFINEKHKKDSNFKNTHFNNCINNMYKVKELILSFGLDIVKNTNNSLYNFLVKVNDSIKSGALIDINNNNVSVTDNEFEPNKVNDISKNVDKYAGKLNQKYLQNIIRELNAKLKVSSIDKLRRVIDGL